MCMRKLLYWNGRKLQPVVVVPTKKVSQIFPLDSHPCASVTTHAVTSSWASGGSFSAAFVNFPVSPWPLNDDATWLLLQVLFSHHTHSPWVSSLTTWVTIYRPIIPRSVSLTQLSPPTFRSEDLLDLLLGSPRATQNWQAHELQCLHSAQFVFSLLEWHH